MENTLRPSSQGFSNCFVKTFYISEMVKMMKTPTLSIFNSCFTYIFVVFHCQEELRTNNSE